MEAALLALREVFGRVTLDPDGGPVLSAGQPSCYYAFAGASVVAIIWVPGYDLVRPESPPVAISWLEPISVRTRDESCQDWREAADEEEDERFNDFLWRLTSRHQTIVEGY